MPAPKWLRKIKDIALGVVGMVGVVQATQDQIEQDAAKRREEARLDAARTLKEKYP